MFPQLHSGELYDPGEPELQKYQAECLERSYDFNATRPSQGEERQRLLKEMLADCGEDCYVEPPFHANFGGRHCHFGAGVYANFNLTCVDDTHIWVGDGTKFGPNVTLVTATHPTDPEERSGGMQYNKPVRIGKNCWLGAGVTVLPGVTIGDDTVIGAGSLVTKDIPSGVVAYGIPCRVVRKAKDPQK